MNWARGIDTALAFVACPGCRVQNPVRPNDLGEIDDSCWKCGCKLKPRLDGWDGKPTLPPLPVRKGNLPKWDPCGPGGHVKDMSDYLGSKAISDARGR